MSVDLIFNIFLSRSKKNQQNQLSLSHDFLITLPIALTIYVFFFSGLTKSLLPPPTPSLDLSITTGIPLAFELSVIS